MQTIAGEIHYVTFENISLKATLAHRLIPFLGNQFYAIRNLMA